MCTMVNQKDTAPNVEDSKRFGVMNGLATVAQIATIHKMWEVVIACGPPSQTEVTACGPPRL